MKLFRFTLYIKYMRYVIFESLFESKPLKKLSRYELNDEMQLKMRPLFDKTDLLMFLNFIHIILDYHLSEYINFYTKTHMVIR